MLLMTRLRDEQPLLLRVCRASVSCQACGRRNEFFMSLIPPATPRPNASPATTAPASPAWPALARWAPLRWLVRFLVGAVVVIWSVLLVAWLALHWWILPHIEQWRGPIEMQASRALGVPLRIGQIEVHSSGWVPSVELREVQLLDAQQRTALRLPRVFAAISPRSLLSF